MNPILAVVAGLTISASTSFAHDFYTAVIHKGTERREGEEVRVARITAFFVGAIAITVAITVPITLAVAPSAMNTSENPSTNHSDVRVEPADAGSYSISRNGTPLSSEAGT